MGKKKKHKKQKPVKLTKKDIWLEPLPPEAYQSAEVDQNHLLYDICSRFSFFPPPFQVANDEPYMEWKNDQLKD